MAIWLLQLQQGRNHAILNQQEHNGAHCVVTVSSQAFIEMNSEDAAQTMVGYYSTMTPHIRNHPVYIQFSNHKELKTDNSPNQAVTFSVYVH